MHLDEEQLAAYEDRALPDDERQKMSRHLATCDSCQARRTDALRRREWVTARLDRLAAPERAVNPLPPLARFRRERANGKEQPMINRLFSPRFRGVWLATAAVILAVIALSFQPVQAWAGQFLGLFRVQQVTVLPVDTTGLSQLSGNSALAAQMSQLVSKSVTVLQKPQAARQVASLDQASKQVGFAARLPSSRTDTPTLRVSSASAFQLVVDRVRAQSLLNATGRKDLVLPSSLDGATIKVSIPASLNVSYGNCPVTDEPLQGTSEPSGAGSRGRRMVDCVMLVEMPSPSVETPPNLDVTQLAEIGLEFSGMNSEQARQYSQTVDWTSTLVIPIPRNGASYKQVTVDGVNGYLIQRPLDDAPGYALVWVKSGIIYTIASMTSDTQAALDMANSLK